MTQQQRQVLQQAQKRTMMKTAVMTMVKGQEEKRREVATARTSLRTATIDYSNSK